MLHRDQRGVITGFVVRTLFIFVVLVVGLEEVGQVLLAQVHASSAAGTAAQAGADDYHQSRNANHAEAVARATMASDDPKATMVTFSVATDGTVTVTASEPAATLLLQHLPYISKYRVQRSTEMEFHSLA
jgi:Flp pilus assembly protein TadG